MARSDNQYASQAVPMNKRIKTTTLFGAMAGFVFKTTSLQTGASIGFVTDFPTVVKAVIVGAVFLAVLAAIVAAAAAKSGLSFGQLVLHAYGKVGSKIIGFCLAFSLIGWTAVDAELMSSAITAMVPGVPHLPISLGCCVLFTLTAAFGMKAMSKLGSICIPVIGIFSIVSMMIAVKTIGWAGIMSYVPLPDARAQFGVVVGLVIGSWIGGVCTLLPDLMRFAKSSKHAVGIALVYMLVINPLMLICGAVGAIATGLGDTPFVLAAQGLAIPGLMIGILGNWGPAQGNIYSCSVTWGNFFKVGHKKMVMICGGLALLLTAVNFYNYFSTFLVFLSNAVPAVIGVFIVDFLFTYRKGYPATEKVTWKADWRGIAAVTAGVALGNLSLIAGISLPGITQVWCVAASVALRLVLNLIGKKSPAKIFEKKPFLYHTLSGRTP